VFAARSTTRDHLVSSWQTGGTQAHHPLAPRPLANRFATTVGGLPTRSSQVAAFTSCVTLTASVWRDGRLGEIPIRDVVSGDVIDVRAGGLVPADATLLSTVTLSVDQAALTGESLPVEKRVGAGGKGSAN